jgi:Ca2+-binding EF-hand superfamily protein
MVCAAAAGTSMADPGEGGEKPHKMDPAKRFAMMDADSNGTVTLEEFTVAHEKRKAEMKERRGDQEHPEGARTPPPPEEIFKHIDSNEDGSITLEELTTAHKERMDKKGDKPHKKNKKGKSGED